MSDETVKHQILGHIALTICFFILILSLLWLDDITKVLIAVISCFTAWFLANVWIHIKG